MLCGGVEEGGTGSQSGIGHGEFLCSGATLVRLPGLGGHFWVRAERLPQGLSAAGVGVQTMLLSTLQYLQDCKQWHSSEPPVLL